MNANGDMVLDLKEQWWPKQIYGEQEYGKRVAELRRRRYYGHDSQDKAGILRYTKVTDALFDMQDIPTPRNERELAALLSFSWHVDQCYGTLSELAQHLHEGQRPAFPVLQSLQDMYQTGLTQGLELPAGSRGALMTLGLHDEV